MIVVGTIPIGSSKEALDKPPYRFTLQIPIRTRPNKYYLTAMSSTSPGHLVSSEPIAIKIERPDLPVHLLVLPTTLFDLPVGEAGSALEVIGKFADGTETDLNSSSLVSYVSSAPGVVNVQAEGVVSPVAPGSATIVVTYGNVRSEVPVTVIGNQR